MSAMFIFGEEIGSVLNHFESVPRHFETLRDTSSQFESLGISTRSVLNQLRISYVVLTRNSYPFSADKHIGEVEMRNVDNRT